MKKLLFLLIAGSLFAVNSSAQIKTYPYSYDLYQQINAELYSPDSNLHTSIKPVMLGDAVSLRLLDSITEMEHDSVRRSWVYRKLFQEHLVEMKKEDYSLSLDFLPDFQIGRDVEHHRTTWLNTRGFQVQGNIGKTVSFYTSAYENQSVFPQYMNTFINSRSIIPGLVNDKFGPARNTKDWAWASALINYTPNKHFSFTLGQDKNFIGDGYRSMLLSDVAANYPFLKVVTTLGNVKYVNIWAQFQDLNSPQLSYENGYRKKWGVFHYLDWNVNKRLSLGFFESVIWQSGDDTGRRGFDLSYITPIIFLRTVEGYNGSPDNALLGFNGKYKFAKNLTAYGQFMLDEFTASEFFSRSGYWANKYGVQVGLRSFDVFKVKNLSLLGEFNTARPYTYSSRSSLLNYGHYNQPLAHPFGANFREMLGIVNYSYGKFRVSLQGNHATYGLDPTGENFGKDILLSYNTRQGNYGNEIGQGIQTTFNYLDGRVSWLVNPKTNLRVEAGAVYRKEANSVFSDKTTWFTFGLRSSFRNIYQDF
ncbi:MAG: gliding motility protein RemB [Sphingobacteriaceae bacterium]|jgi:hypothetical protein|nr:gliding motility protein RemB [Sphingobacteriaceae bacterium]